MLGSGRSAGPAGESGRISEVLGFLDSHNAAPLFRLTAGKCDFLVRISRPHFTRTTGAQSEGPMGQRGAWDGDVAPGAWARNNHLFLVGVRGFFDPAGRIAPQIPRLAKKTRRSAARSRRDANPIRLTRPDSWESRLRKFQDAISRGLGVWRYPASRRRRWKEPRRPDKNNARLDRAGAQFRRRIDQIRSGPPRPAGVRSPRAELPRRRRHAPTDSLNYLGTDTRRLPPVPPNEEGFFARVPLPSGACVIRGSNADPPVACGSDVW